MNVFLVHGLLMILVSAVSCQKDCNHTSMDLMFVLDGSGSVRAENWEIVKRWVVYVVSKLDLANIHVGVVQYSHWSSNHALADQPWIVTEIKLGEYKKHHDFEKAVEDISHQGYTTHTAHAINKTVRIDFMGSDRYNDSSVKKVMILLTDGRSNDAHLLPYSASYARSLGITSFAIGVGRSEIEELQIIANGERGNNERVIELDDFSKLNETVSILNEYICHQSSEENAKTAIVIQTTRGSREETTEVANSIVRDDISGCLKRCMDLMFVLDGSGSVGLSNWELVKLWVKSFVDKFDLRQKVAVGVVQYSHWYRYRNHQAYMKTEIGLGEFDDVNRFYDALDKMVLQGFTTYTAHAINKTVNEDFMSSPCFNDSSVKKIMILLTDGLSSDSSELPYAAAHARSNQIITFAIGVGEARIKELQIMATGDLSEEQRVYHVADFGQLAEVMIKLKREMDIDTSGGCKR